MQINSINNSPKFSSRNEVIRFADNVARRVNKAYPRSSSTLYQSLGYSEFFVPNLKDMFTAIECMRLRVSNNIVRKSSSYLERCKALTQEISKTKMGNCHESALLSELAAKVNGISNCFVAELKSEVGGKVKRMDHAVLLVDSVRKPYIIDSWLGFADYIPNAMERYQKEFSSCFDDDCLNKEMFFDILHPKNRLNKEEQKDLRENFTELLIK